MGVASDLCICLLPIGPGVIEESEASCMLSSKVDSSSGRVALGSRSVPSVLACLLLVAPLSSLPAPGGLFLPILGTSSSASDSDEVSRSWSELLEELDDDDDDDDDEDDEDDDEEEDTDRLRLKGFAGAG